MLRLVTSKTRYRATADSSEVIENMERERGLEPPASSLGTSHGGLPQPGMKTSGYRSSLEVPERTEAVVLLAL
jgi:hypothetical protein